MFSQQRNERELSKAKFGFALDALCVGFAGYSTIGAHVPQYEPFFIFGKDERE
jgi:hypothetical protein